MVAPFVGVWIEIRVRYEYYGMEAVAPFVGVWIEINIRYIHILQVPGRSLRGSVD